MPIPPTSLALDRVNGSVSCILPQLTTHDGVTGLNILGIGGYSHDSAAVLVCDGELVAGVAEERVTRVKHQGGVPRKAVEYCLDTAGLTPDDVDHIGCYMRPGLRLSGTMWRCRSGT